MRIDRKRPVASAHAFRAVREHGPRQRAADHEAIAIGGLQKPACALMLLSGQQSVVVAQTCLDGRRLLSDGPHPHDVAREEGRHSLQSYPLFAARRRDTK